MDPGFPEWATSAGVIATLGVVLLLWLRGVLVRSKDCDERIVVLLSVHAHEVELIEASFADKLTALNLAHDNRVRLIQDRLDGLIADRDAWREAHADEAAARRAAETATRHLMESSNVSLGLLAALKDALATASTQPPPLPTT